jgi:NTE family protein
MSDGAAPRPGRASSRGARTGIVLGAGGILGSAWTIGALTAYEQTRGVDARKADVLLGTSAGSVLAALLSLGIDVETMADSEAGRRRDGGLVLDYEALGSSLPPRPRLRIGSRRLLVVSARHPRQVAPLVALVSLLPQGRGTLSALGDLVEAAGRPNSSAAARLDVARVDSAPEALVGAGPLGDAVGEEVLTAVAWPDKPALGVVAMDYDTGERVVFGAAGAPDADLAEAVMASCAIPGWFSPVTVGGHRYVDGGTCSPASVDILLDPLTGLAGLDEVIVLAPACSFEFDHPHGPVARIERHLRRMATRRLEREVEAARAAGVEVTVLCPGPEDLVAIGGNVMDTSRREQVFTTSLRTSEAAFAGGAPGGLAAAG